MFWFLIKQQMQYFCSIHMLSIKVLDSNVWPSLAQWMSRCSAVWWESARYAAQCASRQQFEQWPQQWHVTHCWNSVLEAFLKWEIAALNPRPRLRTEGRNIPAFQYSLLLSSMCHPSGYWRAKCRGDICTKEGWKNRIRSLIVSVVPLI
jgi:hypothetical protein